MVGRFTYKSSSCVVAVVVNPKIRGLLFWRSTPPELKSGFGPELFPEARVKNLSLGSKFLADLWTGPELRLRVGAEVEG